MPVVFAGVAPHGDEIVPVLNPDMDEKCMRLRDAMVNFSVLLLEKRPETIVVATPHNLRLSGWIGIIATSYASGAWRNEHGMISVEASCDKEFATMLYHEAKKEDIPVVLVNFGVSEGELSNMCLDWGTIIPLWFVFNEYKKRDMDEPKIVIVTPSREIDWEYLVRLGEKIGDIANSTGKRIAFIASADQAHTHRSSGPYGYDPKAEEFDKMIYSLIEKNKIGDIVHIDRSIIDRAKPDSIWQMLILVGVLKKSKLRLNEICYECPTYFGMLVASYT